MLEPLQISPAAERMYVALLELGDPTAGQLAQHLAVGRAQVQHSITALEQRGLVSRLPGKPRRYVPADPDVALEALIREGEGDLARLRVDASRLARKRRTAAGSPVALDVVEIVHGREAIAQRWHQVQRNARVQMRSFNKAPFVTETRMNPVEEDQLQAGVVYRAVYERSCLDLPGVFEHVQHQRALGEQSRLAPALPLKLSIADDRLGFAPLTMLDVVHEVVLIHPSALLDALIALFEQVWERSVPIVHAATPGEDGDAPADPTAQALPALLAAGYTDAAIARHLGLAHRTVQRKVRDLLDELGAQSRFQAGALATRRGLI